MAVPRGLLALAALLLVAAKPVTAPYVITAAPGGQPHVPLHIKAVDLDVRVALSYDFVVVLNPEPAARAGLKAFPLIGKGNVTNALLPGGTATYRVNLFGITPKGLPKTNTPVVWLDKPAADDAEGVLPISVLKVDTVVVNLGPQAPGSTVYTLTRPDRDSVAMKMRVGDEVIRVTMELNSPDTVMNARAAAALTNAGLVKRNGSVGLWQVFPGVALPFERLTPAPGATILGLPIGKPAVRITETQARALDARAAAGQSTSDDDGDAVTVTASRKKGRDPWLFIGRDVLGKCSRIVFDRPGKTWQLTCAF